MRNESAFVNRGGEISGLAVLIPGAEQFPLRHGVLHGQLVDPRDKREDDTLDLARSFHKPKCHPRTCSEDPTIRERGA